MQQKIINNEDNSINVDGLTITLENMLFFYETPIQELVDQYTEMLNTQSVQAIDIVMNFIDTLTKLSIIEQACIQEEHFNLISKVKKVIELDIKQTKEVIEIIYKHKVVEKDEALVIMDEAIEIYETNFKTNLNNLYGGDNNTTED